MTLATDEQLLTLEEAAAVLRQSVVSVRRKITAGELGAVRLGPAPKGHLRIPADELERYLERGSQGTRAA